MATAMTKITGKNKCYHHFYRLNISYMNKIHCIHLFFQCLELVAYIKCLYLFILVNQSVFEIKGFLIRNLAYFSELICLSN